MNLYVGLYDYIIFGLLIAMNVLLWKKKLAIKTGCILGLLIFGLILPFISMIIEIDNYQEFSEGKPFDDRLEILYTLYRLPIYWSVGIIQILVLVVKNKLNKTKE
ncbi:MAG: hypothetical protein KUG51_01290 [Urechidicola sp.]|nr:hypothetical protein [Urechidicola sp.]